MQDQGRPSLTPSLGVDLRVRAQSLDKVLGSGFAWRWAVTMPLCFPGLSLMRSLMLSIPLRLGAGLG